MTDRKIGKRLRIMVLFGGRSDEHEVSVLSAVNVLTAMDREKYEPVPVYIGRDGRWRPSDYAAGSLARPTYGPCVFPVPGGRGHLVYLSADGRVGKLQPVDAIFPVLHGQWGEDGSIQGAVITAGVPLVGCGILGSANALDKDIAKRLLGEAGLPVALSMTLRRGHPEPFEKLREKLGAPFFLKPVTQGSSVGVGKVETDEEYRAVLSKGFELDHRMMAEEHITGREIECAVLEGTDGSLCVSKPGEIIPSATHAFYTYDAKYIDPDGAELRVPADLPVDKEASLRAMAAQAFRAVGCDGMARVDFFLKADGELVVNELNTMPGFTDISMYPKLMAASGIAGPELIDRLIAHGLARFRTENSGQ
ncbi:D-alanine--D-alanine ligase family protein [Natronohydrobacter thiooxidans]|uniref:D-alanine--D-alanine ligase family protein n=1 Tax=Natronohydrobacter thiooxidans TaxID=87172 RepID=UPI0008FF41F6|nr:D-alanine--D-alanine ligase family protein [Natronohydrobacter thiooxidans]